MFKSLCQALAVAAVLSLILLLTMGAGTYLSQASGGTGAGSLACANGQFLTSNGTNYYCSNDNVAMVPGSNQQITFNDNYSWGANSGLAYDKLNGVLIVGGATELPGNPLALTGSANSSIQANIQNTNSGGSASGDWIATADNGSNTTYYLDCGINSSGYNDGTFTITGADDGYCYVMGGNYLEGTSSAGKTWGVFTGGTMAANLRLTVADTYLNLASGTMLELSGSPGTTTTVLHGNAGAQGAYSSVKMTDFAAAGSGPHIVSVTGSNYTNSTAALTTITGLTWSTVASTPYMYECHINATGTATGAPQFAVTTTGTITSQSAIIIGETTSSTTPSYLSTAASGTLTASCTSGCLTAFPTQITGMVNEGAGAGTISI